jgi:site-specific DNA-methyltransferase (adenine-specific)
MWGKRDEIKADEGEDGVMLTISCEDCMKLMARFPDKSFDLAIVDPPYGIGAEGGAGGWARKYIPRGKKWDTRPSSEYFLEVFRVSDNQVIFGGNYFNLPVSTGWICWYKSDEIKNRTFSEFELAWTSFDVAARHYTEKPFILNGQRIHPTQKPVKLYKWILQKYAKPGWKILDTHLGSGSIAIACEELGYDLTACEIDRDYYTAAMERVREYQQQQRFDFTGKRGCGQHDEYASGE